MNARPVIRRFVQPAFAVACAVVGVMSWTGMRAQSPVNSDSRLHTAQQLMVQNISFYLDGAVSVDMEGGRVQWEESEKDVLKQLTRIVRQVGELQRVEGLTAEVVFSEEVEALIARVGALTHRDLRHWRMADGLSESDEWYVMVQSALDELKMQISLELNVRLNQALHQKLQELASAGMEEAAIEAAAWLEVDGEAPLPTLEWGWSSTTEAAMSAVDETDSWNQENGDADSWAIWMERLVLLLEQQDRRLQALESRAGEASGLLPPLRSDPTLGHLRLPEFLDVAFYSGSHTLTLNAQLQLNEIMELLGRYPQVRVVCTGHADAQGGRTDNLALSRRRASAVRDYLLQSGVEPQRVLLNYFGEERAMAAGAKDRRVEVRFFVN